MALSPHQALSIVVIICFSPAVVTAGWLCVFRGLGRQWGWLYLLILALVRVVGGSLQIASESTNLDSLSDASKFLSTFGLMALILVMLEIIESVKRKWFERDPIPLTFLRVLHWTQWAAFILSLIATITATDTLWKAAIIIMALMFVGQTGISIVFAIRLKHLLLDRNWILIILLSSIPLLTIRVIYAILDKFVTTGSVFGGPRPNVVAHAFMQYLMEFIVVAMYLVAAFTITSWGDRKPERDEEEFRMSKTSNGDY